MLLDSSCFTCLIFNVKEQVPSVKARDLFYIFFMCSISPNVAHDRVSPDRVISLTRALIKHWTN